MAKLLLVKKHTIISLMNFDGVCHNCNSPISYDGEIIGVEHEKTEHDFRVIPIDLLICSFCENTIEVMRVYTSLNVTKELEVKP